MKKAFLGWGLFVALSSYCFADAALEALARERTAALYEELRNAIYASSPGSLTEFYMMDVGLGCEWGDAAQAEDVFKEIANQSLLVHSLLPEGKVHRSPRTEAISATPFPDYYNAYVQNHKTMPRTPEQEADFNKWNSTIAANGALWVTAQDAFDTQVRAAYQQWREGKISRSSYNARLGAARASFEADPHVRAYNDARQKLQTQRAQLGDAIWRGRQEKATNVAGVWPVQSIPNITTLNADSGWVTHTIKTSDLKKVNQKSTTNAGGSYGGWFFRASGSYTKVDESDDEVIDKMEVTFKVKRVSAFRDWLDAGAFLDDSYNPIKPKEEMAVLSLGLEGTGDGYVGGNGRQKSGACPFIILDMIFVKDVTLKAPWTEKHYKFARESMSGGGSYGFGPFRLGRGNASKTWERTEVNNKEADHEITITSPQLIGYVVFHLPPCPTK